MARIKTIATKQIQAPHWDPHEVAVIRSLNAEDQEIISDEISDISDNGKIKIRAGRNMRLTVQRGLVSWTLTDEQNKPLPLTEESIRSLHQSDLQYIFEQIQELNKPLPASEKKDSSKPPTSGTEDAPATLRKRA